MTALPPTGRLLGVDYGTVRHGLAICDAERRIASPWAIRERKNETADAQYFRQLITAEKIVGLVLGLPLRSDGGDNKQSLEVRKFAEWLARETQLPIVFADERFTTVFAEEALWNAGLTHKQRKARRDAVAAQALLHGYLESDRDPTGQALNG